MERDQLGSLSPADAAVALRSYARRFREAVAEAQREGVVVAAAPAGRRSPVQIVAGAAVGLERLQRGVERALNDEGPALEASLLDDWDAQAVTGPLSRSIDDALRELAAVTAAFADVAQHASLRDWDRAAFVGQRPVTALDLLKQAVAAGRTSLDELGACLAALGARA